jgi:hypothetical protein
VLAIANVRQGVLPANRNGVGWLGVKRGWLRIEQDDNGSHLDLQGLSKHNY